MHHKDIISAHKQFVIDNAGTHTAKELARILDISETWVREIAEAADVILKKEPGTRGKSGNAEPFREKIEHVKGEYSNPQYGTIYGLW